MTLPKLSFSIQIQITCWAWPGAPGLPQAWVMGEAPGRDVTAAAGSVTAARAATAGAETMAAVDRQMAVPAAAVRRSRNEVLRCTPRVAIVTNGKVAADPANSTNAPPVSAPHSVCAFRRAAASKQRPFVSAER